jgi:hypothetical protein
VQNYWPDIASFVYGTVVSMICLSFEDQLHYVQAHFVRRVVCWCGDVAVWWCGGVLMWRFGCVVMWRCGGVVVW